MSNKYPNDFKLLSRLRTRKYPKLRNEFYYTDENGVRFWCSRWLLLLGSHYSDDCDKCPNTPLDKDGCEYPVEYFTRTKIITSISATATTTTLTTSIARLRSLWPRIALAALVGGLFVVITVIVVVIIIVVFVVVIVELVYVRMIDFVQVVIIVITVLPYYVSVVYLGVVGSGDLCVLKPVLAPVAFVRFAVD